MLLWEVQMMKLFIIVRIIQSKSLKNNEKSYQ